MQAWGSLQNPHHLSRKGALQQLQCEPGSLQNCPLWLPSSPQKEQKEKKRGFSIPGGPYKKGTGEL